MIKNADIKLFFLIFVLAAALAACQNANASTPDSPAQTEAPPQSGSENKSDRLSEVPIMLQLAPLKPGEELAVLHTTMGDVTLRFFPEEAPLAVENFLTHAKDGYYDNVLFHRVLNDFMIQGGDPLGTGMGGESIWGSGFGPEFSLNLHHFRGALAMAHSSQPNSNGSQFYIVQNPILGEDYVEYFETMLTQQDNVVGQDDEGRDVYMRNIFPAEALDEYIENGGTPHLDLLLNEGGHTVFGHVAEGMDVVDAIAATPVNTSGKPLTDVLITSISFKNAP
jgi:peptidyl-prolyl cis-trans isomerase B (cyclophilin B)